MNKFDNPEITCFGLLILCVFLMFDISNKKLFQHLFTVNLFSQWCILLHLNVQCQTLSERALDIILFRLFNEIDGHHL